MQTLTVTEKSNTAGITAMPKSRHQSFFAPAKVQPKLTIGAADDPYEREADAMAERVMRMPAAGIQQPFFKPAPSLIQRQDDPTKTLTEGAGVVKDQLENNPGFAEWKDKQTDALKKKVWDDQPTEFKAGIIGFGLSSAGILGTVFATNPGFRADTIKLLDDKNIALPLSLIPYHEYFPLSSFKYKLPSTAGAATEFSTEFEFKPFLDLMHQKWSFIPKTDITLGIDTAYSQSGGFGFKGGSIKIKFGGGIINLQGFVNQTLPVTPMLVSGNNPGESPMWIMRTLPGQFEDQLPKGSGVYLSVDVLRLPELWKGEGKKTEVRRKCAKCEEEDQLQRKESGTNESGATSLVDQTLQSSGAPLDKGTKSFMEDRFGYDFSNVKIHTGSVAAKSAGSINALAYTSGNNIVFNQNQYSPQSESGRKLLAHELTHVVQQSHNDTSHLQRQPAPPKYYTYTTSDYVQQVIDALNQTNPVAGVGDPAVAYTILNALDPPQLTDVLLQIGINNLSILTGYQSPSHVNGVRTELYVKAARMVLMPSGTVKTSDISEVIDHFGILDRQQQSAIVKFMRQSAELDKALNAIYSAKTRYQTNTELNGLSVGNFDFSYAACAIEVNVRVKFDFASSIARSKQSAFKTRFFDAIHNKWNNKYKLTSKDPACACKIIPIGIHAAETTGKDEHKVVDVHDEKDYREKVIDEMNVDISSSDNTLAHEFGHVLGLYDEYDGGWLENHMFWHNTSHIDDKTALMNEGTELRDRYFAQYRDEVYAASAPDCEYTIEKI